MSDEAADDGDGVGADDVASERVSGDDAEPSYVDSGATGPFSGGRTAPDSDDGGGGASNGDAEAAHDGAGQPGAGSDAAELPFGGAGASAVDADALQPGEPAADDAGDDATEWPRTDADSGATAEPDEPATDAPLSGVADAVRERRERTTGGAERELFEEQEVAEIDTDVVWDRLEDDEPASGAVTPGAEPDGPGAEAAESRDVREVPTADYCERCPFFSEPPDVRCTSEGTQILEVVDMDHVRVADCPKVRENERLEEL